MQIFFSSSVTHRKPDRSSIKIIEARSQPNLRSMPVDSPSPPASARDNRKSDESFIQMENLVSKLCLSPEKAAELNNTLDIVDFILNNGPKQTLKEPDIKNVKTENEVKIGTTYKVAEKDIKIEKTSPENQISPKKELLLAEILTPNPKIKAVVKTSPKYYTPIKSPKKQADVFVTPSSKMMEARTPTFKTPANPRSLKKPSAVSLWTTPNKSPMYKNIKSPIATYIKGSVEVPLVTNVCPKKPLPGGSLIPKLVKKEPVTKQNKENINLPTSAYKSAKTTRVVRIDTECTDLAQLREPLITYKINKVVFTILQCSR